MYLFIISLSLILVLGCQIFSPLSGLKSTAESVATDVNAGKEFLGTGEAFVTEVAGSGAAETAKAFVTQEVPRLKETAQAIATDVLVTPSDVPDDIPIMEGEKSAFVGSVKALSYIIEKEFSAVLDFYETEMPTKGWTKIESSSGTAGSQAELHFEKDGRSATVVIAQVPFTLKTMVVINLAEK